MKMEKLDKIDMKWILRRLPRQVREQMKKADLVLAGGFIRACIAGQDVNDIDMFASTPKEAEYAADAMKAELNGTLFKTDNAYTVKGLAVPIQYVHRWVFDNPSSVVESFDFTIARAAIWFDRADYCWESAIDPDFYRDLAGRRLIYRSPERNEDAGGSMLRVLKFYKRGYRIPIDSLGAVLARLIKGIETPDPREAMFAEQISELLFMVDPDIDPLHEAH